MYNEDKAFGISELSFINEILFKADDTLRSSINNHILRFVKVITDHSQIKGIKWDDLVIKFEWSFEADRIKDFLNSHETGLKET